MKRKPLALFFLCFLLFLLLIYCGLNMAERGLKELIALEEPDSAFNFKREEGRLVINFAGRNYSIPLPLY